MSGQTDEVTEVVKDISELWGGLGAEQYAVLQENTSLHQYEKNEIIYKSEEKPCDVLFLAQGKVKIYKEGIGGRAQIIRAIKPSEFFAFRAFFADEPYRTSAMAMEECLVASVPASVLLKLMEDNFNINLFFIKYLCTEIGHSDQRIVNLTQKHVRGRLAEALLFLRDSYGLEDDGCSLCSCMSREEIANLSNMTTSNAIRTLSSFAADNLIAIDGRKIRLLDEEELQKISREG